MRKPTLDTPRDGKAWCDVVNSEPMPAVPMNKTMAIGSCDADGSNFKPYAKPIMREVPAPSGSYLWLGDYRI